MMKYQLEDLGVGALGDVWIQWQHARHPQTGAEYALGSLSMGGFGLIEAGTWKFRQVRPERPFHCGWAIGQAPNGDIYHCDYNGPLVAWDWKCERARIVCDRRFESIFTLDIAPDGRVYLPEYTSNILNHFDPATGKCESLGDFHAFGQHVRDVSCDPDGMVYLTCYSYDPTGGGTTLVQFDPRTNEKRRVDKSSRPTEPAGLPLRFRDGSAITVAKENTITHKDAAGRESTFTVNLEGSPLRIFSVEPGGGSIWGGTFIPLTLFSYDPATGQFTRYGNPTKTNGEIYSMVFSRGKLYLASYVNGHLTRFDPATATPTQLGLMKAEGLPLQRPHGRALGPDGSVYFAAHGGYGCVDSGICRIDPATDQVTRWNYPRTTFDSMTFVQLNKQLLVSENREGEKANRFTFLSPNDGKIVWSEPVIHDQGAVVSWLDTGGDVVFGMHAYRATLFAFSVSQKMIVAEMQEMRVGDHCNNALVRGLDGRIWGVTNRCVYAVTDDLKSVEVIAELGPDADKTFNRFGLCRGPDNAIYFCSGTHLMRVRADT